MEAGWGTVMVGVLARPEHPGPQARAWLARLPEELPHTALTHVIVSALPADGRLTLVLPPAADPFQVVLQAGLAEGRRAMRWAIAAGLIEDGGGPPTGAVGQVLQPAIEALAAGRYRREHLVVLTGDGQADSLLADLAPTLTSLLDDLTDRQRQIGRLLLVNGLRRSEIADHLGITRPTVSVMVDRARLREIGRLARALRTIFFDGLARASAKRGT